MTVQRPFCLIDALAGELQAKLLLRRKHCLQAPAKVGRRASGSNRPSALSSCACATKDTIVRYPARNRAPKWEWYVRQMGLVPIQRAHSSANA